MGRHRLSLSSIQDAEKGIQYLKFPPVLMLHLKRFEYDVEKGTMKKVPLCFMSLCGVHVVWLNDACPMFLQRVFAAGQVCQRGCNHAAHRGLQVIDEHQFYEEINLGQFTAKDGKPPSMKEDNEGLEGASPDDIWVLHRSALPAPRFWSESASASSGQGRDTSSSLWQVRGSRG